MGHRRQQLLHPGLAALTAAGLLAAAAGCGDAGPDWPARLAAFTNGTAVAPLQAELQRAGAPCRPVPGQPEGQAQVIYFLPRGDLHLTLATNEVGVAVIAQPPLYVISPRAVDLRLRVWDQGHPPAGESRAP